MGLGGLTMGLGGVMMGLGGLTMGLGGPSAQQPQHGQGSALPADKGTAEDRENPPSDESSPAATRAEAAGVGLTSGTGHPSTPAPLAVELSAGSASSALLLCIAPSRWLKNPATPASTAMAHKPWSQS